MFGLEDCSRETLLVKARLAEQAERFDDMVVVMRRLAQLPDLDSELTPEERNLLSVAYKSKVGLRRTSWRSVLALEQKSAIKEKERNLARQYRDNIEQELVESCNEIIGLLDSSVLQRASSPEAKVFFLKMKGDYYRYMAEIKMFDKDTENNNVEDIVDRAMVSYKTANDLATSSLTPTNPVRLGLALNYSVFYFEIKNMPDEACRLAKQAFEDSNADIDNLDELTFKDSTVIMQLLRDNLTLWTASEEEQSYYAVGVGPTDGPSDAAADDSNDEDDSINK